MATVELKTRRLTLRKQRIADAQTLYRELGCDPEMFRYTGWNPYFSEENAVKILSEQIAKDSDPFSFSWVIESEGATVGIIGAYDYQEEVRSIEIGYSIFHSQWGRGYASEAVLCVVPYLLGLNGIDKIVSWTDAENTASASVLRKASLYQTDVTTEERNGIPVQILHFTTENKA